MNRNLTLALFIILILGSTSCLEKVDGFLENTISNVIVVYGLVTDDPDEQWITVSLTADLARPPFPVSGVTIMLIENEQSVAQFEEVNQGEYKLDNFQLGEEASYKVSLTMPDGTVLESNYQTLPKQQLDFDVDFEFKTDEFGSANNSPVLNTYVHTRFSESDEPIFIRYRVQEVEFWERTWVTPGMQFPPDPCYIFGMPDPSRLVIFSSIGSQEEVETKLVSRRLVSNTFNGLYYQNVRQISMNPEAYNFWIRVNQIYQNKGSVFDIPYATIPGNIEVVEGREEKVLGFIEISRSKVFRKRNSGGDFPYYFPSNCDFIQGKPIDQYLPECVDCSARARGRYWVTTAPAWWGEGD